MNESTSTNETPQEQEQTQPSQSKKASSATQESYFVPHLGIVKAKDQADLEAKVKKLSK